MSFEATFESNENGQNQPVESSFHRELNNEGDGGDSFIKDVLARNEATILQSAEKIAEHFDNMLNRLPMSDQKAVIDGFPADLGKHDVVYLAMQKRFAQRTA